MTARMIAISTTVTTATKISPTALGIFGSFKVRTPLAYDDPGERQNNERNGDDSGQIQVFDHLRYAAAILVSYWLVA